ncbi:MAG: hypothetical protein Q4D65_07290 [Peptostreptococcaceae bacterium]|nr:hypothetical protein [Peptostreptococcaceae bacterium]
MLELIEKYKSVSFIGMSKNAGKTTTLNFFINEARGNFTLGLSSIGRDGETLDRVTGTAKPRIYIHKGTIVTTAAACLKLSDATLEILEVTDIHTPMGAIVISRAVSDGYIELAGPSTNYQTRYAIERMFEYGAQKVFVDGALSRKSFASPSVAEATILSTGAAISGNFNRIIEETVHSYRVLTVPKFFDDEIISILEKDESSVMLMDEEKNIFYRADVTIIGNEKMIAEQIDDHTRIIYTSGAITDAFVDLILRNLKLKAKPSILVDDGTKIFVNASNLARLQTKGIGIYALSEINVVGITVNPFSASDYAMDSQKIIGALEKYINIPIFDVMNRGTS